MNKNLNFELKMQSWVDGELNTTDAQRLERQLASDAAAGGLVAELRAIKSAMAGNELAAVVPDTREFYWSQIQRRISAEERAGQKTFGPARQSPWMRWLAPLTGVTALACLLIMSVRPVTNNSSAFDEITSTGEGMEAVTFHDQSAGMTVVWLADSDDSAQAQPVKAVNAGETHATEMPAPEKSIDLTPELE